MIIFESIFPKDFRQAEIKKILDYVTVGKFCQLVCMPGAGKSTILRLLAHNRDLLKFHLQGKEKSLRFVYVNLLELANFEEAQIAKFLLIALDQTPKIDADPLILTKQFTETVNSLANKGKTIIFLFDHFDEYQNRLPRLFFQMLKSAKNLAKYKFSAVFATRRDLTDLIDEEIVRDYWDFFVGNTVYVNIYDQKTTDYLFTQIEKIFGKKFSHTNKLQIVNLTGGHAKLTKIISELVLGQNIKLTHELILQNTQVLSALYELWIALTSVEQLQMVQLAKNPEGADFFEEDLINSNLIAKTEHKGSNGYKFTIPIFAEFAKAITPDGNYKITYNPQTREILKDKNVISELLTAQEFRLLRFLVQNQGRVIERNEIITDVWPDTKNTDAISDEAIDQMVFRIRKKIEDEPANPRHIMTVKGRGLRFEP